MVRRGGRIVYSKLFKRGEGGMRGATGSRVQVE